jgi:serine/threonine protein kinase
MIPPNIVLQNRYCVLRELGRGGMGTVYEAIDQRVNCIVALKETIAGNDEEARRAFEREASLLGNLRHSNLPKVMDYFTEGDGDFLVMEFIPGYDLAELLESREGSFPQSQVLRWADELFKRRHLARMNGGQCLGVDRERPTRISRRSSARESTERRTQSDSRRQL